MRTKQNGKIKEMIGLNRRRGGYFIFLMAIYMYIYSTTEATHKRTGQHLVDSGPGRVQAAVRRMYLFLFFFTMADSESPTVIKLRVEWPSYK